MLYLNPPFFVIDGVSLLPDHADPLQFYYLPMMPRLTTVKDAASGAELPQLQLIKFRGRAGNGGFLNFDVNLGIDPDDLADVARQLRSQANLPDPPRLAPVPLVGGTVKLLLLGAESPSPAGSSTSSGTSTTSGAAAAPQRFVVKLQHSAHPSLYGDNQAAFSVELDQDGVVLMEKALQGDLAPVGVVYELNFLALRPAYRVHLSIDWDRVQTQLGESFGGGFLFVSTEVDKEIDKLIENRTIVIEADTFVPEGEDTKGIIANKDAAISEVKDMIRETFFQSTLLPPKPGEPDDWDKAAHFANSMAEIPIRAGASALGGLSYKTVDLTRIDRKNLNVEISERTTVQRTIYPQGHLAGLFKLLREGNLPLERFMLSVDLDDPWFERRRVEVISRADLAGDGISNIDVVLSYHGAPRTVVLDAASGRGTVDWPSVVTANGLDRASSYHYTVGFQGADRSQRPVELTTAEIPFSEDALEIVPRGLLYSILDVPIVALSFPWERYPVLEVRCRYRDESSKIALDQAFLLDAAHTFATWRVFLGDPEKKAVDYKLIYRAADNRDIEAPWVTTESGFVTVRDPFPAKRTLAIVPRLNWKEIDRAFVDLTYDDGSGAPVQASFELNSTDTSTKTFAVDLKDPDRRTIDYEVTILFADGRSLQVPRSSTSESRLLVATDMRGHRVVPIATESPDFAGRHVTRIDLELRYTDPAHGLATNDSLTLKAGSDRGRFEYDFIDPAHAACEYKASYLFDNGLLREGDWTALHEASLVLPIA